MINPEALGDKSDDQLMRLITLGLAVHWTAASEHLGLREVTGIAERMAKYIETGERPA